MRLLRLISAIVVLSCGCYAASPTFTGIVNPASNIPPGLPNYGIAEGSIFVIYGANLGPATLAQAAALPFPTTAGLSGTSITITVGGTTVTAPMIYTVATQVAAILPSSTPVGTGTLTLTYNGSSGSTPITVVQSNFGISTVNLTGGGSAVVTYGDYSLVTSTKSAKPNDTIVIWGTGLGPITGSDAILPTEVDLGTPIQVFIGGVQATVLYRGRSASPGLDQINVSVPAGVSGCSVSLVVQTGNLVSNNTTVAVSPTGGTCSDPTLTQGPSYPAGKTSLKLGSLSLFSESASLSGVNTTIFGADALFENITGSLSSVSVSTQGVTTATASVGSCTVLTANALISSTGGGGTGGAGGPTVTFLDSGTVGLTSPSGNVLPLTAEQTGFYSGLLTSLSPGAYKFSNGSGGKDIGPFTASVAAAQPLTWTNSTIANSPIDRTKPLTITWTGGVQSDNLALSLDSEFVTSTTITSSLVVCTAPVSAGQFTVPPSVLLSLIPSTVGSVNSISVFGLGDINVQPLTISGIDLAYGVWESIVENSVTFK